jgi:hypothetical protein
MAKSAEKRSVMKKRLSLGLLVLFLCIPGFAQKKEPEFPQIITASQFAFVETIYGPVDSTTMDPRVSPEDRRAVANIEDAIRKWGRYRLTIKRSEAELVFVVRKGMLVAANGGVKISRPPQNPGGPPTQTGPGNWPGSGPGNGPEYGAEAGPPYDLLFVYTKKPDGPLMGPLWKRTQDHGLDAPDPPLLKNFKDAVEAAAAKQAKKTP